jgi:ATP-dependent DNA helicase RecG
MNVTTEHNLNKDLLITLNGLIANWENNVIEFNESGKDYDNEKIGKYFSALSNEANLRGLQYAWLVFGVNKKTKGIIGTDYRMTKSLDSLKHEIAQNSTDGITFTDIYEVYNGTGNDAIRVVMFKIPATVAGLPTAWKNTWYRREGESLGTLSMEEVDLLRSKSSNDWSKQIIKDSSLRHLDTKAIKLARQKFMSKKTNNYLRAEMDQMSNEEFLTKLKLVVDGKLTNAAMVLLGNPDYDYIMDTIARIMRRLYDSKKMV